jgi:hypothetical protein
LELTIKFLEGWLSEAEKLVGIYTTLLSELKKTDTDLTKTKASQKFLSLVAGGQIKEKKEDE